jgi:hypothetical protein
MTLMFTKLHLQDRLRLEKRVEQTDKEAADFSLLTLCYTFWVLDKYSHDGLHAEGGICRLLRVGNKEVPVRHPGL